MWKKTHITNPIINLPVCTLPEWLLRFVTSISPFYYSHLMVRCFYLHLLTTLAQVLPIPASFFYPAQPSEDSHEFRTEARLYVKLEKSNLYACEWQTHPAHMQQNKKKWQKSVSEALRRVKYERGKCPSVFKQPWPTERVQLLRVRHLGSLSQTAQGLKP